MWTSSTTTATASGWFLSGSGKREATRKWEKESFYRTLILGSGFKYGTNFWWLRSTYYYPFLFHRRRHSNTRKRKAKREREQSQRQRKNPFLVKWNRENTNKRERMMMMMMREKGKCAKRYTHTFIFRKNRFLSSMHVVKFLCPFSCKEVLLRIFYLCSMVTGCNTRLSLCGETTSLFLSKTRVPDAQRYIKMWTAHYSSPVRKCA